MADPLTSKGFRRPRDFSPLKASDSVAWIFLYLIGTGGSVYCLSYVVGMGLALYPHVGSLSDIAVMLLTPEILTFGAVLFFTSDSAPYGEKDRFVVPLAFSLAMTAPVFVADIYILYIFSQVH